MKRVKILFFILMFLVTSLSIAQYGIETSINDYQTKKDGDWSNYSVVWERWNGTEWVAANSYPDWQNANTITIKHNVTLDVDITIDQMLIQPGTFTVSSGRILVVRNAGEQYDLLNRWNLVNQGTIIVNSGAVLFNDEFAMYYHARDGGVIPSMEWSFGNCIITGVQTNAPSVNTQTNLYTVTWNCPNQTAAVTLDTDLNPISQLSIESTGIGSLNIPAMTFLGNIEQSPGTEVILGGNINVGDFSYYYNNGILNCGNNQITGDGNFTLCNDATLKTSHISGIDGSIMLTGTKTFGVSNYVYNGPSDQETGKLLPYEVSSIEKDNGEVLMLTNDSVYVVDSLLLTNGKFWLGKGKHILLIDTTQITGSSPFNMIVLEDKTSNVKVIPTSSLEGGGDYINIFLPIGTYNEDTKEFEYSPADIELIVNQQGPFSTILSVFCDDTTYANPGWDYYLERYWQFVCTGNTNYRGVLTYLESDIYGGSEEEIQFGRYRDFWLMSGGSIDRELNRLTFDSCGGTYYFSGIQEGGIELNLKVFLQGAYR